jgi:FixJ family two-component response regulator
MASGAVVQEIPEWRSVRNSLVRPTAQLGQRATVHQLTSDGRRFQHDVLKAMRENSGLVTGNLVARKAPPAIDIHMGQAAIVHIIDDDESQRETLVSLLGSVDLQGRAYPSVAAFLAAKLPDAPGCLILDVRLPGTSGLDFQVQLAEKGIRLPVIFMTAHGDVPMSVRGMKAGAVDFLTKPFRGQDMLDAINVAIERDQARRNAEATTAALREKFETLSTREREVMLLVTAGKMNKQVAGDLGLSEVTVKIHRGSVMRKMGVRTLADLVRIAEALGLSGR